MEGNHQVGERKKRKRVSKKSKRSWRKNTDIKDIEEHLEEVRRQERLGGLISLKENEQLFFVDQDNIVDTKDEGHGKVKKQKKLQRNSTKVFMESYMKPVLGRKQKTRKNKAKLSADCTVDEYSSEEEEEKRFICNKPSDHHKITGYDLWDSHDSKSDQAAENQHHLKATKKYPVKQPKTAYQVRSKVPALAVCHSGASYNPTLEDHQSLLMTACQVEIGKEKEIQKIQKKLQQLPEEELAKLPSWEEEMSQGLFISGSQNTAEERESGDEEEELEILPQGQTRCRKTTKEKRKETDRKIEEQLVHKLRKEKAKENDVFRVKTIKKQIRQADEKIKQRREKKREIDAKSSLKPRRLGKHKFEEMNIEVQLTSELTGSLRTLKPEGNMFEDRFKNLQRRNIIEPRKPIAPHRKYGLKEYQKRSYKNYDLQEKLRDRRKK